MTFEQIAGTAHAPAGVPAGVVLLTHGAGGSRESPLLVRACEQWARRGWLAVRYNLPFRRHRPTGPPSGSATADRAGVAEAIALAHTLVDGPVIAGGHSYGGRLTSMTVAEEPGLVAALKAAGVVAPVDFIAQQRGMFSYSGLSAPQMQRLRSEFGVYGVDSGRICVAALNEGNLPRVAAAIAAVIKA